MVNSEIDIRQIRKAIRRLPIQERARLIDSFQRETWNERFKQLLKRIDNRLAHRPISRKQILKSVEKAREEYHDQGRH